MPLSELTELVTALDGASLELPAEVGALTRRIEEIGAMLERIGAANAAAQLALAANLLTRAGRSGDGADDVRQTVLTLVGTVERAFHLGPRTVERARTPGGAGKGGAEPASADTQARLRVARDMLLGEMLVHFGVVGQAELAKALELQRGSGRRLGEVLVEHGFTTPGEIELALDYQKRIRAVASGARVGAPAGSARTQAGAASGRMPPPPLPAEKRAAPLRMATELLLGEILVLQGALTRRELEQALQQQRKSGLLLGETLLRSGRVTRNQLQGALTLQGTRRRSRSRRAG